VVLHQFTTLGTMCPLPGSLLSFNRPVTLTTTVTIDLAAHS